MPNTNTAPTPTAIRLILDGPLYEAYAIQAKESNQDIEAVILKRLSDFRDQDTFKGRKLLIPAPERQIIERLFSRSFKDAQDFVRFLREVYAVQVGEVRVETSGVILQRLKDRCGPRRDFTEFVNMVVRQCLEHYVGLR